MVREMLALLLLCFAYSLACFALLLLLAQICFVSLSCDILNLIGLLVWFRHLRRSLACELTAHLIRAWLAFEPFWSNFFDWDFQLRGILFKKWSWARFFRRPLYQCDFEICSTTPQLDPNRKPIWFCNCKLRYTVWEIWESRLVHIQLWAILKQLLGSLPPFLPHDQYARGVVGCCEIEISLLACLICSALVILLACLLAYLLWFNSFVCFASSA